MKIPAIINKSKIVFAPLLATGLVLGCQNMNNITAQRQKDEFVSKENSMTSPSKNNSKEQKQHSSLVGSLFLGLLATFVGASLLANNKKDENLK